MDTNEKEQLRAKLVEIQNILSTIPGVHLQDIRKFINGNVSVNKQNNLKLPLMLPAEQLLHDPKNIMDVFDGNWKMVPIIMFIENTPS